MKEYGKICPKCSSAMRAQDKLVGWNWAAVHVTESGEGMHEGGKVIPYCCENCGYIELYDERKLTRP